MDWMVLIFLLPLVVVPLVFLTGFAGCGFAPTQVTGGNGNGNGTQAPPAPSNLTATALSSSKIGLTWTDNATNTTAFRIERSENGAPPVSLPPIPGTPLTFTDTGLTEAKTYEYQIFATMVGPPESAGSNMASATTLAIAYQTALATDDAGWEGNTMVQRIAAAQIHKSGTAVVLTLRGSTTADLQINKVAISQPAATMQAWDPGPDLIEVRFAQGSGVTIAANSTETSDLTNYNLVSGNDLLVAFNIGGTNGAARRVALAGCNMYSKKNTAEATSPNRTANYIPHPTSVYIVEEIDVPP